jgi:hypothetical protein
MSNVAVASAMGAPFRAAHGAVLVGVMARKSASRVISKISR